MSNCGQVVTPTTDETPIPCDDFRSARCTLYEDAIAYLGLPVNTPINEVIDALLTSLIDARVRIQLLESITSNTVNNITDTSYQFVITDAGAIVTVNNGAGGTIEVPEDATLDYPIGTEIKLFNIGAASYTLSGEAGVTFVGGFNTNRISGTSIILTKIAANTWFGDDSNN